MYREVLTDAVAGESKAEYDSASGDLIVSYRLGRDVEKPKTLPNIFALGPNGFQQPVPITKLADKSYRGRIHIGQQQGLFRIRPLEESRAFPEVGYYRQEQELLDYGSNQFLLRSISDYTGGEFNPAPQEGVDGGGRSGSSCPPICPRAFSFAVCSILAGVSLSQR